MTAGLPGTGIGGVFYLLSALLMPIVEIVLTIRGKSSVARWMLVLRQLAMGFTILGTMWLLGLFAGVVYNIFASAKPVLPGLIRDMHAHIMQTAVHINIFHLTPVIMSILTLATILTLTHVLRLFVRPLADEV